MLHTKAGPIALVLPTTPRAVGGHIGIPTPRAVLPTTPRAAALPTEARARSRACLERLVYNVLDPDIHRTLQEAVARVGERRQHETALCIAGAGDARLAVLTLAAAAVVRQPCQGGVELAEVVTGLGAELRCLLSS